MLNSLCPASKSYRNLSLALKLCRRFHIGNMTMLCLSTVTSGKLTWQYTTHHLHIDIQIYIYNLRITPTWKETSSPILPSRMGSAPGKDSSMTPPRGSTLDVVKVNTEAWTTSTKAFKKPAEMWNSNKKYTPQNSHGYPKWWSQKADSFQIMGLFSVLNLSLGVFSLFTNTWTSFTCVFHHSINNIPTFKQVMNTHLF